MPTFDADMRFRTNSVAYVSFEKIRVAELVTEIGHFGKWQL